MLIDHQQYSGGRFLEKSPRHTVQLADADLMSIYSYLTNHYVPYSSLAVTRLIDFLVFMEILNCLGSFAWMYL